MGREVIGHLINHKAEVMKTAFFIYTRDIIYTPIKVVSQIYMYFLPLLQPKEWNY